MRSRSPAERRADLQRKLVMLERHRAAIDPVSGKSGLAVRGGIVAGRIAVEKDPAGPAGFGLRLALRRWHPGAEK